MIRAVIRAYRAWRARMLLRDLNVYVAALVVACGRGDWEKAALFRADCDRCLFRLRRLYPVRNPE